MQDLFSCPDQVHFQFYFRIIKGLVSNKRMILCLFYTVSELFCHTKALSSRENIVNLPFFRPVLILENLNFLKL